MRFNIQHQFFCLILMSFLPFSVMGNASSGSVAIGDESRTVVDAVAVLSDFLGKRSVEVLLFDRELTSSQRNTVVIGGVEMASRLGFATLGRLRLFFREGSESCDGTVTSYTAIFEKSATFDFKVQTDAPLNWAFSAEDMQDYGVKQSECLLAHGATLKLAMAHEFLLDKALESKYFQKPILQSNQPELLFRWDVHVNTTLLERETVFQASRQGSAKLRLATAQVVDTDVIYINKTNALAVRFFSAEVATERRGTRAGPNGSTHLGSLYLVFDRSSREPVVTYCSISISVFVTKSQRRDHSAECHLTGQTLTVSGNPQKAEIVRLVANGTAPADAGVERPPMEWRLDLPILIDGRFEN